MFVLSLKTAGFTQEGKSPPLTVTEIKKGVLCLFFQVATNNGSGAAQSFGALVMGADQEADPPHPQNITRSKCFVNLFYTSFFSTVFFFINLFSITAVKQFKSSTRVCGFPTT